MGFSPSEAVTSKGSDARKVSHWVKSAQKHRKTFVCASFFLLVSGKRNLSRYSQKILDRFPFFTQHVGALMDEGQPISYSPICFP